MSEHIRSYFCPTSGQSPRGNFHKVIALHEQRDISWQEVHLMVPNLPKGWYELSRLPLMDRIEFLGDYWLSVLPFQPRCSQFLLRFFSSLEEIDVYLTQSAFDQPFEAQLVYGLKGDNGFFQGKLPATEEDLIELQNVFPEIVLPNDYLAFLRLHNGFAKCADTGIFCFHTLIQLYPHFLETLQSNLPLKDVNNQLVEERALIPFYGSFEFPCYQCFWAQWHPQQEMGNIYYSGLTHTISNHGSPEPSPENQAFPTFLDWLIFYLETIDS